MQVRTAGATHRYSESDWPRLGVLAPSYPSTAHGQEQCAFKACLVRGLTRAAFACRNCGTRPRRRGSTRIQRLDANTCSSGRAARSVFGPTSCLSHAKIAIRCCQRGARAVCAHYGRLRGALRSERESSPPNGEKRPKARIAAAATRRVDAFGSLADNAAPAGSRERVQAWQNAGGNDALNGSACQMARPRNT